jgi:hypothetical protein
MANRNTKPPSTGRVTKPVRHSGNRTGRYVSAEERGRYTAPRSRSQRESPWWFGWLVVGQFVLGLFIIVLNYLSVLPGSTSAWYLLAGVGVIFTGFITLLRYH